MVAGGWAGLLDEGSVEDDGAPAWCCRGQLRGSRGGRSAVGAQLAALVFLQPRERDQAAFGDEYLSSSLTAIWLPADLHAMARGHWQRPSTSASTPPASCLLPGPSPCNSSPSTARRLGCHQSRGGPPASQLGIRPDLHAACSDPVCRAGSRALGERSGIPLPRWYASVAIPIRAGQDAVSTGSGGRRSPRCCRAWLSSGCVPGRLIGNRAARASRLPGWERFATRQGRQRSRAM